MNGEVKEFKLNKPMYWDVFKSMPEDLKKEYIDGLRKRFDVPDTKIAEMFGVGIGTLSRWFKCYGLSVAGNRGKRKWDEDGWDRWRGAKIDLPEVPVAEKNPADVAMETLDNMADDQELECVRDVLERSEPHAEAVEEADVEVFNQYVGYLKHGSEGHVERKRCVPGNGKMTFDGPIEEIVETLRMLLAGAEVTLDVAWTVIEKE